MLWPHLFGTLIQTSQQSTHSCPKPLFGLFGSVSLFFLQFSCSSSCRRNSVFLAVPQNSQHCIHLQCMYFSIEHSDDLDLSSGETVYLLERIDDEWYRGKCKNRTGIFPASFVKVIVSRPLPVKYSAFHLCIHLSSNLMSPLCILLNMPCR